MYSRVYVEITNICNLSCDFCHKTKRKKRQMTYEEFDSILQKLDGVTKYIYFHVMGEPLTHPLLPDFIRLAHSRGFFPVITTNGTLLPTVGDRLIGSGLYKINISLHCTEGGKDEYIDNCIEFADRASKSGILTVLRLWNGQSADALNNDKTVKHVISHFEGCTPVMGQRGMRIRDKLHFDFEDRFDWPDSDLPDIGNRVICRGLGDHFGILVDGSVVPCCLDADGAVTLGNIHEQNIGDILSSERAENMRNGFKNKLASEPLCRKCGYARRFKL